MNLDELKKQEDIKIAAEDSLKQQMPKIEERLKQCIETAISDFEKFFTEKEFSIQKGHLSVVAKYGSLSAELRYGSKLFAYMGSLFFFDFNTMLPDKVKYSISVHPTKNQPEGIATSKWEYRYIKERNSIPVKQPVKMPSFYDSIYEVLSSIVTP